MIRDRRARRRWATRLAAAAALLLAAAPDTRGHARGGWAWFAPDVEIGERDRQRLDRNEVVVKVLPARDAQLGVFVATRIDAGPEALVAWTRQIVALKRSESVLAAGRFSRVPALADVAALELDRVDVDAIRSCAPRDCPLKLTAVEIERLRAAAGREDGDWRGRVQREFRHVVLARLDDYASGGLRAVPPVADGRETTRLHDTFETILANSPVLTDAPVATRWLREAGFAVAGVESFLYWSKERYGAGKTVITLSHVGIVREPSDGAPAVLVLSKQIMSTRYVTGALGLSAVVADERGRAHLAYINRSAPDLLRGTLGGMIRRLVEDRARSEAPDFVRIARTRLESGDPPGPSRGEQ